MEADLRSAHPDFPGVPWWGAVLIAIAGTALGFALDAMTNGEKLTGAFAGCYAAGCVVAVLAVRYSSVFTAVVQPPLILFVSVPTAYLLMSNASLAGGKSTAITIGYPLIERFPLMISTALGVLIIGVVRWYWGMFTSKPGAAKESTGKPARERRASKTDRASRTGDRVRAPRRTGSRAPALPLIDSDGAAPRTTSRARRPGTSAPEPSRAGRVANDAPPRRRSARNPEPAPRRSGGAPWDEQPPMRTPRRRAAPRSDFDEQPRYREPSREPVLEPRASRPIPRVRYRDEPPPPARRRRDDRYDAWEYDR